MQAIYAHRRNLGKYRKRHVREKLFTLVPTEARSHFQDFLPGFLHCRRVNSCRHLFRNNSVTSLLWPRVLFTLPFFRGNSSLAYGPPPSGRPPCRPWCLGRRPWAPWPPASLPHCSGSQVRAGQTDGQYGPMAEPRLTQGVGGKGRVA